MTSKRIFITGASGCIGHYIVDALIQHTEHELFLLVRDPSKLQINSEARPGIHLLQGDMLNIEQHTSLLKTMDQAILIATAWGGPNTHDINVTKTIRLLNLLNPDLCEQVVYFSTASILGRDNKPLRQAGELGTDYVRTKYECHQRLSKLAIAPQITTVFPTLVFGGDQTKPLSQISSGLPQVVKWINLIRFLKADGGFHYIHCADITKVVMHLLDHPPAEGEPRELVLGNAPMTVNAAVEEACHYLNKHIYFRIPLTLGLANFFIKVFNIQMAAWDRFCMEYRHFTYERHVNPATYGTVPHCSTLSDVLKVSGIYPPKS
ncbi:NAD-dependent epimerase/dehydratase family protein [Leptolyngbya sp. AN02str]|uniref:NAD-dependent epimerase/dehydratase family protein n=1 Tax=Leptolyngbya sp. AN02str TaxID=3423363 RepID=UPI003D310AFC